MRRSVIQMIGLGGLCLLLAVPVQAKTVLKIASLAPEGSVWMRLMRTGAEEVQKRTQGRVGFKFYPGGVMGDDQSVLRKIRVGQLHGGAVTAGGLSTVYPDAQIYSLPFLFRSSREVDYVREQMDQQILDGLRKNGFVSFGVAEGGFAYLMADKPVRTADDLKTQKVWVPRGDVISHTVYQKGGISPIALPTADVLTALQTGLINTVSTSPIGMLALQWHTRIKYFTNTPLLYIYAMLAVDKRAFDRITAADQKIVEEVMRSTFVELNKQNRADNEAALEVLKKQGIQFVVMSETDIQHWKKVAGIAMKELEANGVYSGNMLKILQGHLADFRKRVQR